MENLNCYWCDHEVFPNDETVFGEHIFHPQCLDYYLDEDPNVKGFLEAVKNVDKAKRFNEGKIQYSYLYQFPNALGELCRICEQGATKYGEGNWQKGGKPDKEYLDSASRHLMEYGKGYSIDSESTRHHLIHAAWNLLALVELNYFNTYGTKYEEYNDVPF